MVKRVISGIFLSALVLVVLFFCQQWVMCVFMCLFSVVAVYEFLTATGFVKNRAMVLTGVTFAALVIPWIYRGGGYESANMAIFLFAAVLFALALGSQRQVTLEQIAGTFFAAIFIPMAMSSILRIRMMENGIYLVLLPFIAAYVNDTCAFFVGRKLGHTRLAPGISPKKTWEGSIGGLTGAVVGNVLYGVILWYWGGFTVNWTVLVVVSLLGGVAGQFGDLCMSYIKRQFGIKDYGDVIPGHGGVLDRIDSLLFTAPVVELIMMVAKKVLIG